MACTDVSETLREAFHIALPEGSLLGQRGAILDTTGLICRRTAETGVLAEKMEGGMMDRSGNGNGV